MSRTAGFQILIADDEKVQREMLAGFLNKQGYKTVSVEDGAKALDRYSSGSFDLVLTDFRMPGMDGFTLLTELKRRNPE
ncbi:MAG: response regulator, partial [Deltaproteobacteria bacterium]